MKRPKGRTFRDYAGFAGEALFCGWPILLGVWTNIQAPHTAGQGIDWFFVARGTALAVLGAASCHLFFHSLGRLHVVRALLSFPFFLACLTIGLCSTLTVTTNGSATILDGKWSQKVTSDDKKSLETRRDAQKGTIGEAFRSRTALRANIKILPNDIISVIDTRIEGYKRLGTYYLQYTDGCKADKMYPQAQDFCDGLGELKAKKDAALERDSLQSQINAKGEGVAPTSMDPFADAVAFVLGRIGYKEFEAEGKDGEKKKAQIGLAKDWGTGIWLVLAEQLGPTFMAMLLQMIKERFKVEAPQPKRERKPVKHVSRADAEASGMAVAPPAMDIYKSFVERRLERCEGAKEIKAGPSGPMFQLWCEDCAIRGVAPGTYHMFGRRLKKYVDHKDTGRPAWLNVRIKDVGQASHAPLRLAVVNA